MICENSGDRYYSTIWFDYEPLHLHKVFTTFLQKARLIRKATFSYFYSKGQTL